MRALSTDLDDLEAQPYCVWDHEITWRELREKLQVEDADERALWMARVMREARYQDVFRLLRLADVLALWPRIERHLGRSRAFWIWLIEGWRADGLIPRNPAADVGPGAADRQPDPDHP